MFTINPTVTFTWSAPASWGNGCGNALSYHLCISSTNGGACDRYDLANINSASTSDSSFVPSYEGVHYWRIAAVNNGQTTWSTWKSFSVKVIPNCSNLSGPTEVQVGSVGNFSADFSSPMGSLKGDIYRTDLTAGNDILTNTIAGNSGSLTGGWTPVSTEKGNKTVYCRAWNDSKSECRDPAFPTSPWPLAQCAGPTTSFNTCIENFTAPADPVVGNSYVTGWSTWSTCDNGPGVNTHTRFRTRTCTEDCLGVTNNCANYFAGNCVGGGCTVAGNTQTQRENCSGVVQGHLYDASDCASGCSCGAASSPIINSSFTVSGANSWSITPNPLTLGLDANGFYNFTAFLGNSGNTFTFDFSNLVAAGLIGDAVPKANCNEATPTLLGCDTGYVGAQPCRTDTADFGFYRKYGGWWQVTGGSIHANTTIQSKIPASLTLVSDQRLIKPDSYGRDGIITYGTSVNLGTNPNVQNTYSLSNRRFQQTYQGLTYNYAFFDTKFKANTFTEWASGNTPPAYSDPSGNGYMLIRYTGAGPLTINAFSVLSGQKYVILIPQSVTVSGNITVASGGFLAILSNQDIHFGTGVSIAHGWYLTDGKIVTDSTGVETTDKQFHGEGSFVALNGFSFNRDRGVLNNKTPSQEFIYRGDLITNNPSIFKFPYKYYAPYNP
ncbi:MAG TPA: hypothetical protein VF837_01560 [Patescibacteria group bacterium]